MGSVQIRHRSCQLDCENWNKPFWNRLQNPIWFSRSVCLSMIPKLLIQNFYFHNFCSTKSNLFTVEPESKIIDEVKEWILTRNHQDHLPKTKSKLQNTIEPKCFVRVKGVMSSTILSLLTSNWFWGRNGYNKLMWGIHLVEL